MEMEKKKQLTMRSSSCTGMNRLIVIDLEVDKESERQRYGQTSMWATGKIQAKRTWTLIIKGREFFLFWALIHVNVLGQPNRGKLKTHSIKNANGRTEKDDSMRG